MTNRLSIAVSATFAILAMTSLAEAQTAPTPPATVPAQGAVVKKPVDPRLDDQAIICRRLEETGSRLGSTKECHTRAEWNGRAAQAREQSDRILNTPQISTSH